MRGIDEFHCYIKGGQHDGHTHVLRLEKHPSGALVKPVAIRTPATYGDPEGDPILPEGILLLTTERHDGLPVYVWQAIDKHLEAIR